jgi:hypothetical protein
MNPIHRLATEMGVIGQELDLLMSQMRVAEELLAQSSSDCFAILYATAPIINHGEDVYRAHCAELIARAEKGEDTRPGTKAEVLCQMLAVSLKAPLRQDGQALTEHLFAELFPGRMAFETREVYEGQVAEDLHDARRKLRDETRVWPKP